MTLDATITHIISEQRELSRQQRQATLTRVAELMREKGASERAIHTALAGFHAFLQPALHIPASSAPDTSDTSNTSDTMDTISAPGIILSDIETRPIQWLWPHRLPSGKLTILEGEAGIGTSLLALTLAACISGGHPLPDGTPGAQGKVILIAPQSNPATILKPRLEAAQGDPSQVLLLNTAETLDVQRITLYDRPFSLPDHLNLLEETIARHHPLLVIIDPLTTIIRGSQSPITEILFQLAALSERTGCAILLVRHLTSQRAATTLIRDTGFPGLTASIPTILRLIKDPDSEQQRLLVSIKHTLSSAPAILKFQLTTTSASIPLLHCLGETRPYSLIQPEVSNLSTQRQAILQLLGESLQPLTPAAIARQTNLSYDSVRLLLGRMVESHEIGHPARGYYIAHQHHSLDTPNPHPPATTNTFDTFDTSTQPIPPPSLLTTHPPYPRRNHCKGGGGVDAGRGPLRSPSW